jgi:hypothetical protein
MDADMIKLKSEVIALNLAVAVLIRELPDQQRNAVLTGIAKFIAASDIYNADFAPTRSGRKRRTRHRTP